MVDERVKIAEWYRNMWVSDHARIAALILCGVVLRCQRRHSWSTLYHPTKVVRLNYGVRIRSRITVHLADFQLQLNWLPGWASNGLTKSAQYPNVIDVVPQCNRAQTCEELYYRTCVNDVRRTWTCTIFTMSGWSWFVPTIGKFQAMANSLEFVEI